MTDRLNVLISLHRGYGVGDAVQVSSVLRHVRKHRPNWRFDYRAEGRFHCVGQGIAAATFAYGDPNPTDHYDAEVQICLYDTWANFHDRPNTRVSSTLRERFDIDWDQECARYRVDVSTKAARAAHAILARERAVAVHYLGDSDPEHKNLTHQQANEVCRAIDHLGYMPVVLNWRGNCQLTNWRKLTMPTEWGRDPEMVCAVVQHCAAFVGIDSGPSKCASATETPALVVWTGHHPAPFHDPAPNTTHLVPEGYHGLYPVCGDRGVVEWFEAHHKVVQYERDPVEEVGRWLERTLPRG